MENRGDTYGFDDKNQKKVRIEAEWVCEVKERMMYSSSSNDEIGILRISVYAMVLECIPTTCIYVSLNPAFCNLS